MNKVCARSFFFDGIFLRTGVKFLYPLSRPPSNLSFGNKSPFPPGFIYLRRIFSTKLEETVEDLHIESSERNFHRKWKLDFLSQNENKITKVSNFVFLPDSNQWSIDEICSFIEINIPCG